MFNLSNEGLYICFLICNLLLEGLVLTSPAICAGESTYLADATHAHIIVKVNYLVPLGLVPDKVHLDGFLMAFSVCDYICDACGEPLTHLVEYVHAIVQLEVHTTTPLLKQAWAADIYPLVILRIEAGVMDGNFSIDLIDIFYFCIAPLLHGV